MYRNKKEILFYCLLSVIMKNSSGSESVQCGKNVCRGQKVCLLNVKMEIMLVDKTTGACRETTGACGGCP